MAGRVWADRMPTAVHQEARPRLLAAFQGHGPLVRGVIPVRGRDRAAELHVPAQVELVGDVVQVFQRVGLRGEMLLPVPFLHQFLGKRIAVGPAFGIEAGAGIAVPVPGAADVGAGLEDARGHAEFAQAVEHEHAGNPGADDDRVVGRDLILRWPLRQDVRVRHGCVSLSRRGEIRGASCQSGGICHRPFRACQRCGFDWIGPKIDRSSSGRPMVG